MSSGQLDFLEALLVSRVRITDACLLSLPPRTADQRHIQPLPKVIYLADGDLEYVLGDQKIHLGKGGMLLRPPSAPAYWYTLSGCELCFAEFETFGLETDYPPLWLAADAGEEMDAFKHLRDLVRIDDPPARITAEAEFKGLMGRLFSQWQRLSRDALSAMASGQAVRPGEAAVRDALRWLDHHIDHPAPITGLAERVGLSEDHFRRVFRRFVGSSPQAYLQRLRLNTARSYLEQSNLPVKEVARLVGIRDPLYFSRLYRIYMGRTPSSDRQHLADDPSLLKPIEAPPDAPPNSGNP